ncbi:beta-galactosidase, putative [Cordyceps militaris CM01]|uniref:Beta-galactosidase n=1 Tax=Cordyceps militaris (strain CM01) TaxID=983644 RepID=G3JA38_CORMM|nr:beta-galactosidase, putative [Cordyceps militaris CM01]EGX95058.1 beta-galactosidase, putative [Cordyceps militaris CM01]
MGSVRGVSAFNAENVLLALFEQYWILLYPAMKLSLSLLAALAMPVVQSLVLGGRNQAYSIIHEPAKRELLQDLITWDDKSLFIRGERALMFSGEFHPFRLPVPSLYLDVFQKIKAMGFNMVSFYVDWALLEGKPGEFRAHGIFSLEPFFEAATKAGVYLLARPGPYINAEVSGGGYPGWIQRIKGVLRTDAPDYLEATNNYMANIGAIIAKAQITNGGPVILFQPENEYSGASVSPFPNKKYMQYVIDQARKSGIVVPLIDNDSYPGGTGAPGTGEGEVDIYGFDSYPLGFDCGHPDLWPAGNLPTDLHETHMRLSPSTPFSIVEFQGGSYDPFGGFGFDQCYKLLNHEFSRVFDKNNLAAGVNIFNIYMIFGGTNWGNLGHPNGYTSYDYGASIREDRYIGREKYSEMKLEAQFMRVSPSILQATPGNVTTGVYSDSKDIAITPMLSNKTGSYFLARHADYQSRDSTSYTFKLPTSQGTLYIPQLGGKLTLSGRDSKFHVTDYAVGDHTLLYSTAEIMTWKKSDNRTLVILYGGLGELHEFALKNAIGVDNAYGSQMDYKQRNSSVIVQFTPTPERQVICFGDLTIFMLDRNSAYNYWVPVLPKGGSAYGSSVMNPETIIVNGGYLVRSASINGDTVSIQADFNQTTFLEIIGAPRHASKLSINGQPTCFKKTADGTWLSKPAIRFPAVNLPSLHSLDWHAIDSLPEIQPGYDDALWTKANHSTTTNPRGTPLKTPVSLYGSDYGFNTGTMLFRGIFTAAGDEDQLVLTTSGGEAYAASAWIDDTFIGSFDGARNWDTVVVTHAVPRLPAGSRHVLTVVMDSTGFNENLTPGNDDMKAPRGILDYRLHKAAARNSSSRAPTPITDWKIAGNLGGEDYKDRFRGPLNEGGLFFERNGYHQPSPPLGLFTKASPFAGTTKEGITYYTARLDLDLPADQYDIPIAFRFDNSSDAASPAYRTLLYVNGFQYGKYISNIGPQTEFPVPEGILNYNGENWPGVSVWALDGNGARIPGLSLTSRAPVLTSRDRVQLVDGPTYSKRDDAF